MLCIATVCVQQDTWSYSDWAKEAAPGEPVDHPFLPIAYDAAEHQ
jgi:hypothetical protein